MDHYKLDTNSVTVYPGPAKPGYALSLQIV